MRRPMSRDPDFYRHGLERLDDMPTHIRSALTPVNVSIPVKKGRRALGIWLAVYLFEHRDTPQERRVLLHLLGT